MESTSWSGRTPPIRCWGDCRSRSTGCSSPRARRNWRSARKANLISTPSAPPGTGCRTAPPSASVLRSTSSPATSARWRSTPIWSCRAPTGRGRWCATDSSRWGIIFFVERFSLYLFPLRRGDIVVFNTDGLIADSRKLSDVSGFYYIKRLVGLPGDTLKIVDNVLHVKPRGEKEFRPIAEFNPVFEKLYSGKGGYQGHLNFMGHHLAAPGSEYVVPEDHYFMMGDNSQFSLDSRFFGAVPRENLVGKAWIVFWPFSRRWGRIDRVGPVDAPTGEARRGTFPVMYRQ
ncbi:MAG: signal peptidase I [Lentisphaeria bacterium]|nr:MAG: signal peptidase I [Lentisphaeria bacterium]